MDRQMGEILRKQEQQEQKAYQSAEMLVDMMRSDFVNSTAVLSMLDQNAAHLPELFRLTDAPVWSFDGKSIPIRRSDQFAAAKHTLCQIPYFHSHNGCELIYVFRGCCKQRFIPADTTLVLREKQACLVHPGAIHAIERCHEQDIILKFMIPSSFLRKQALPLSVYREHLLPYLTGVPQRLTFICRLCSLRHVPGVRSGSRPYTVI